MANDWYCQIDQKTHGPLTSHDLKRMAESGKLKARDLVKKTAAGKWVPASSVKGLTFRAADEGLPPTEQVPSTPPTAGKTCPLCRANLPLGAVFCVGCGYDFRTAKRHSPAAPSKNAGRRSLVLGSIAASVLLVGGLAIYLVAFRGEQAPPSGSTKVTQSTGLGTTKPSNGSKKQQEEVGKPAQKENSAGETKPENQNQGDRDAAMRKELKNLLAQRKNRWGGKQPKTDKDAQERMFKRLSAILETKELGDWKEAVRTIGVNVDGLNFFVILGNYEPLFKEDNFQREASARYRLRIKQLPKQSIEHWREAFRKVDPGYYKKADGNIAILLSALLLLEVDRLFPQEKFRQEESIRLLGRLKSIPQTTIKTWVANDIPGEVFAAIMLMQIDMLFDNDQFESSRLESAIRILKELKENKDK